MPSGMRNETLALWIADNQLQSQDSFGEENTSSSGKELINGEEWNWRSDIHSSKDGTLLERTITVTLPRVRQPRLRVIKASIINPGRHKMINRQQGFTLLEVMAALAIFSMLSVLAFMIFSQASELHQRSQKEIRSSISYSAPSPFLITISCNWSPGGIGVRTKSWCWVRSYFYHAKSRSAGSSQ